MTFQNDEASTHYYMVSTQKTLIRNAYSDALPLHCDFIPDRWQWYSKIWFYHFKRTLMFFLKGQEEYWCWLIFFWNISLNFASHTRKVNICRKNPVFSNWKMTFLCYIFSMRPTDLALLSKHFFVENNF